MTFVFWQPIRSINFLNISIHSSRITQLYLILFLANRLVLRGLKVKKWHSFRRGGGRGAFDRLQCGMVANIFILRIVSLWFICKTITLTRLDWSPVYCLWTSPPWSWLRFRKSRVSKWQGKSSLILVMRSSIFKRVNWICVQYSVHQSANVSLRNLEYHNNNNTTAFI